ncbi:MAG: hypothetical protein CMP21_01045 [Rickettsiales bacterium]|nr:hypothetical protein [Rickettsiales bacterium]|tara:strand:+ start:26648 stop:27775 length:1128 start_codon:yes stop_codon:yes gene_type:complete
MVKTVQQFANNAPVRFWSFLLAFLAIAVLTIFFIFLNPALQKDLSTSSSNSGKVDSYPLILQKDIHLGIESILKKVVGVGRYEISVVANVNYEKVVKSSVSYETDKNDDFSSGDVEFDLPGLFGSGLSNENSSSDLDSSSSDLPGFSDLFSDTSQEKTSQPSALGDSAQKVNIAPVNEGSLTGKNGYKQVKEYVQKDYEINGFLISVVVDGNYFSPTDQVILDLKSLIKHLGVLDPKRGDKLEIRVIEFSDLSSDSTFIMRMLKSILLNPILIIILAVSLLGFIGYKFFMANKHTKALAKIEEEKTAKLLEAENAKNSEMERLKTEKAYQELLATFDNSPDVTANILSDWMESDGGAAEGAESAETDSDAEEAAS